MRQNRYLVIHKLDTNLFNETLSHKLTQANACCYAEVFGEDTCHVMMFPFKLCNAYVSYLLHSLNYM